MIEADVDQNGLDGGRRLQSGGYRIYFEAIILSTSSVRADIVAQAGVALTEANSAIQESFITQLANTGITVGSIALVMAPRQFQRKVPVNSRGVVESIWDLPVPDPDPVVVGGGTTEEAGISGATIGIIIGSLLGLGCCVTCCYGYWLVRKRFRES